ncbi:MAG: minor capsid protein [Erysipelotrichaceae bacterium]
MNEININIMLNTKWVGNGNYSDRIWKNQNQMVDKLSEIVTRGAMTGMSVERMQMEFRQTFHVEKYKVERLLRTEMAYFHNEAEQESYRDLGIEQYIYIATLDNRTSEVCSVVFKTKDGKVGVNLPPMHPNCRSTTGPYYNDSILKDMKRRARNQEGAGKEIEYKNYREWEKSLLDRMSKNSERMSKESYIGEWEGTTGTLISKEQRTEIIEYAKNKGIKIYNIKKFDGDPELLKREIDVLSELVQEFDPNLKIVLDSYPMVDGDYGMANKSNVIINSKALRDRNLTNKNMQGFFANPTIEGIAAHEFAHILENKYGKFGVEVFKKAYYNIFEEELTNFELPNIIENLYGEAALLYTKSVKKPFDVKGYTELTAEIFSKYQAGGDKVTNEFIKLVKEIIDEKSRS